MFKFFTVIGIIAGVLIIALAIWQHKKTLDVSAPLRAAKVLQKATQQDAYIEYARTRSPPPPTTTTPPPPSLATVNKNPGAMGFHPSHYPPALHKPACFSSQWQQWYGQSSPFHSSSNCTMKTWQPVMRTAGH